MQTFFRNNIKIILAIIFTTGIVFLFWININKWTNMNYSTSKESEFLWGATVRPYALEKTHAGYDAQKTFDQELSYLKEVNANTVRINLESDWTLNDYMINKINGNNFRSVVVLEESQDFNQEANYENRGYNYGKSIAERYKGKITYYQMLNEVTGVTFRKASDTGPTIDNRYGFKFDENRLKNVKDYLKGMSRAIKEYDPSAKRIISGNWILVDSIKYLIDNGVDFETVGWNWSTGLGEDITNKKIDEGGIFNLPEIIKGWGKDLLIIEFNQDDGSYNNTEIKQAEYFQKFLFNHNNLVNLSGILVFTLTDTNEAGPTGSLGLIHITENSLDGQYMFDSKKPSFEVFKNAIKDYHN